jgi:glucan-binding YG repeat protein
MTEETKKAQEIAAPQEGQIQSFDPKAKKKKKPAKADTKAKGATAESEKDTTKSEDKKADEEKKDGAVDYSYPFLLDRITKMLNSKSKDSSAKKKVLIKPPDVQRLTGKRSAWVNFDVPYFLNIL